MASNYICHLAVFRKSLFDAIGGERPECDGAQDHDLILRLTQYRYALAEENADELRELLKEGRIMRENLD